ncbi:Protein fam72a [Entomortierella chlamydospora]|nr:Protein fam72a [Entomortierella chlamydospora]
MPQYSQYQYQYQHHPSAGPPGVPTSGYYGRGHNNAYYRRGEGGRNGYSSYYTPQGNGSHGHSGSGNQSKTVCRMDCRYCSAVICLRGMKAMLLADTTVELYSTDHPPGSVQLIEKDYTTSNCKCKIRDVACRVCGNIIGYHITQPCQQCLKAPNNGHFWMFHTEGVVGQERLSMDLGKLAQKLITLSRQQQQQELQQRQLRGSIDSISSRTNSNNINDNHTNDEVTESATNRQTSVSGQHHHQQQQQHRPHSRLASPTPSPTRTDPNASVSEGSRTSRISLASDAGSEVPLRTASEVLATLPIARLLQPMKWEQLPHPDLDIDLDPNSMGGEPLFAEQWTEMVMRTAEAAAANMSLALDQEEETERFLERMMEEKNLELEDSDIDGVEEDSDDDNFSEVDTRDMVAARENQRETMEQLIDQVGEFDLASPPPGVEDRKDEDCNGSYMDDNRNDWRGARAFNHRRRESQPNMAPAPRQQGSPSLSSVSTTPSPVISRNRERSRRRGSATSTETIHNPSLGICPAFAQSSASIAKAAASAAAADAASAANSLLYGRRIRRDYDMMCR